MEIAGLVDYEQLFELELRNPASDQPLGIKFQIRSSESGAAKRVLRQHTDKALERRVKNKMPKSEQLIQDELEKAASYIASWDWGASTYEGAKPEFDMKTAMRILEKEGWIYAQVVEAANKIENFTPRSPKNSATTSD